MNLRLLASALALALAATSATAEITPPRGEYDPRVRFVDYNAADVVRIATFFGVSTHIQLGADESIRDVAVGDDQAWKIVPRGNHLFVKPMAQKADTNVTVVTNRRTYHFALIVQPRARTDSKAWADPNLIFSLAFKYPGEEAAAAAASQFAANQARVQREQAALVRSTLAEAVQASGAGNPGQPQARMNTDYWGNGAREISPTKAWDDGRFMFLTFGNNRDMPAIYSVDDSGNESLVNTNVVDGNTIVLQRMFPKVVLRKGGMVASVINKSFDVDGGIDNTTGTASPHVTRVIKGAQK